MSAMQQNPDGSWSPAEPLPYYPGIDWEVGQHRAVAYDGDTVLTEVTARWSWLLRVRVRLAHRQLLRAGHKALGSS